MHAFFSVEHLGGGVCCLRGTLSLGGYQGSFSGIVLDAVGTLIEPVPSVAEAYAAAAQAQGVELDTEIVRARFAAAFSAAEESDGRSSWETDEARERARWRRIVGSVLPEVPNPSLAFEGLWLHFGLPESWRAFEDDEGLLSSAEEAGIVCCVASNFDARLRAILRGIKPLERLESSAVISSEVLFRKPHPSFYAAAEGVLGIDRTQLLFVGDDWTNDVEGPLRAGFGGALLLDRKGRRPGVTPRVTSLCELAGGLGRAGAGG